MKTSRILSGRSLGFLLAWSLVLVAQATGRAWADDVPRYKLSVGDELTYRTAEGPSDEKQDAQCAESEWVLTVVEQNSDGGWRVLFRERTSYGSSYERTSAGYFDLKPDGRIAENRTINVHANPTPLFPVLPPDADAIKNGWSSATPIDETRCSYTAPAGPPGPDAETWTFEEDIDNVFSPIYEVTRHGTNEFDLQRGIIRKLTTTSKQGWPKSQEERRPYRCDGTRRATHDRKSRANGSEQGNDALLRRAAPPTATRWKRPTLRT